MATVTRLVYRLLAGDNYIDLSKGLMVHNRSKKYHQKEIYTVVGGMVVDNADNTIEISTAPNTWYTRESVMRGFAKWKHYRHKILAETGLEPSENADFKIFLNNQGTSKYLTPIAKDRNPLAVQEWTYSHVENDAGDQRSFQIVGDHNANRYGLLKGWLSNMALPQASAPAMPDLDGNSTPDYQEDYLNSLDGTNDNITDQTEDVVEENDSIPYVLSQVYGSDITSNDNLQMQCFTYLSSVNPQQMIPGFEALCGLIRVDATVGTEENGAFLILDVLSSGRPFS